MAFYELVIEGRQGTQDMLTVLHYQSSGVEPPNFGAAATVIRGHLADHMAAFCGPHVTWVGITVREDIPGGVGTFIPFAGGTLAGTVAGGDQINQVAVLVHKLSDGLVRPTKGWFFQGGIDTVGASAGSIWEAGLLTGVEAYAEDIRILNIAGPTTLTMVIKARNPTAPNTQPYSVVNAVDATNIPRVLRNRRAGAGS